MILSLLLFGRRSSQTSQPGNTSYLAHMTLTRVQALSACQTTQGFKKERL